MNNEKLQQVLDEHVNVIATQPYSKLAELVNNEVEVREINVEDKEYQLDTRVFYDDKSRKVIRITVSLYEPKSIHSWWNFWKNMDQPVLSKSVLVSEEEQKV